LENFFTLRAEKQNHIIDAALTAFARNGYKKTSISDIAERAGIAKGMVNYYFGSKKNLYLHLAELCFGILNKTMEENYDASVTEYFDRLKMMADIKIAAMKEHPAIYPFIASIYHETDEEVRNELNHYFSEGYKTRESLITRDVDVSRFKADIDPKMLDRLFAWAAEGYAAGSAKDQSLAHEQSFVNDIYTCMGWMKKYFYVEDS